MLRPPAWRMLAALVAFYAGAAILATWPFVLSFRDTLPANGDPHDPTVQPPGQAPDHFYQGDIATHGVHIEFIADSDNALTTVPLDEVDAEQTVVLLPGERGNVGEQYGRGPEKPLVATAAPMN